MMSKTVLKLRDNWKFAQVENMGKVNKLLKSAVENFTSIIHVWPYLPKWEICNLLKC